jgi:phage protein D/phage baseplate assembly protein gpV
MSADALRLPPRIIAVNGRALPDSDLAALGCIRVSQKLSLPAQCELTFCHQPNATLVAALAPGAELRVAVGDAIPPLFTGEITAVEFVYEPAQGRKLRVRGYDLLHRLRKRQPVRAHVQAGLPELASEMAKALGLTLEGPSGGVVWRRLIQHGQTDLDFLAQMSGACGIYFTLRGEKLHLLTLEGIGEPIPLSLGDTLLEACIEVNGDPGCRSVATEGWNLLRAEDHKGRASQARVGRSVPAEVPPEQVGGEPERLFVHQTVQDDTHAEALAQAELDLRVAREVVLRGVAEGNPLLRPGARVALQGVASAVAGRYVLTEVTHILDGQHGFISEISSYPAAPASMAPAASILMGKVTSVDDPDALGRVQVALPACNGVETDWMPVVTVGAGASKGLVMLPDVGDTVLILCAQGDPAQGVVLGGLYGPGGLPEGCLETGSIKRFTYVSRGGQRLSFDDEKRSVRLETADGNLIELSPGKVVLRAAADLDIEAPGKTVTIRGKAVNFDQG